MRGTARITELAVELGSGPRWAMVRSHFGISAFGVNAYVADEPSVAVIGEHDEVGHSSRHHEELYFVADGHAKFTVDGDEIDAPAGTFVHATPGTKRGAIAVAPETTIVAFGAKPGVPHEVSPWEEIFVAMGYLKLGEEEKGRQAMAAAIAVRPNDWQGQYNAACFESLSGYKEATITHLRRAIELDPKAREFAAEDSDFDWIRDDAEFPA